MLLSGKPKIYKATDLPNFGRFMDSVDIKKYVGLISVKTCPPRDALHFPVLPRRANDGTLVHTISQKSFLLHMISDICSMSNV